MQGKFFRRSSCYGVKLTNHTNVVPRLGMVGVIPPFHHVST